MADIIKIKVTASLTIEWSDDPTDDDINPNTLWNLLDKALSGKVIRCQTTRFVGRKKTSTKFTPKLELKKIPNG